MTRTPAFARPAGLAALSAAALLALTACGGSDAPASSESTSASSTSTTPSVSTESSTSASASASATESSSSASSTAAAADYTPGACFTADVGVRDLSNFTPVDCAEKHTAEYLWAVPAADPADTASTTAAVCQAEGARLAKEEERLNGAVVTAAELSSFGSEGTHCVAYAVSGEWTGQLADPEMTLEKATEENAAATS